MNILIAANYGTPASGNFIGSLMDLSVVLRKNGDRIFFIFPSNDNTIRRESWTKWLEDEGFPVFLIDLSMSDDKQLSFLKTVIQDCDIDILHIHFGLFHHFALHNRDELPVSVLVHEHMEYPVGSIFYRQTLKYAARSALYRKNNIGIICVNNRVSRAQVFARHYFVPNGLSFRRNIKRSRTREECREELGFVPDEKVVLFLGWDVYRKGLDVAVRAVEECRKRLQNVVLAVVGIGDPPSEERLSFIQEKTGIIPDVPWIRYLPSTEDMFAYHRASDVYLSASRSEAFSYGILESISQDKPVVLSDIKGTSWAFSYDHSYTYPVEDHQKCADVILEALRNGVSGSNREEILKEYSIDKWIENIIMIYRDYS